MTDRPRVENAPGISWRRKGDGWEASWRARADLVKRGFSPKYRPLWSGLAPTEAEAAEISDTCRQLQDEMLVFSRGGIGQVSVYDGSLKSLIECYQTDLDSPYHKKRYGVRKNHDITYRRIVARHGHEEIRDIKGRTLLSWHKEWKGGEDGTKIAMAHAFIGHLRTLFGFGFTILEDAECQRLCLMMHEMKFENSKPRDESLTAEQAILIRKVAREHFGWPSIALAQAAEFDLILRQKDVIGEWVPLTEPGLSDVIRHNIKWVKKEGAMVRVESTEKWLRGLRWSEIDENMILRHNTSKRGKDLTVDLKLAPMVLEELELGICTRDDSSPMIICEATGLPWTAAEFRRKWRKVATKAGIPKNVKNMDSRAGAITEATDAEIDMEFIRQAATHSNISMTQRYSRGADKKVAKVQLLRLEHRNKPKTE